MRMKRRVDAKHERRSRIETQSFASDAALRSGDFRGVRLLEPTAAPRPGEIHPVVAVSLPVNRCGNRLGHVSLLAVKEHVFAHELTVVFCECYCR